VLVARGSWLVVTKPDPSEKPSLQSRATTAKLYIELNQLPQAIEILDELVLENDQEIEPWHLLAICHSAGDTYAAEECLNKAIEVRREHQRMPSHRRVSLLTC